MLKKKGKHEDIIFEAGEDLYSATTGEIRLLKNGFKYIPIVNERRFESYFFEFCGLVSLSYKTLRFQMEHRDINPDKIVVSSCSIKVLHNSEFFLSPATSLRNSLELLQSSEIGSDLTITINENHKIQAHKCILACRSPVFATILADSSLSTLHISTVKQIYFIAYPG
jgi:speckle-type POZ protein